ncbi:hypothetical protein KC921_01935 [Candidatus Woesebacteria bacterium]|nr:hypothetical protein [Candidatus Woesebacteria bacterium]
MQQIAKGAIQFVEQSQETFAGIDQDQYESTYTSLIATLGLNNVNQVRNWLLEQHPSKLNTKTVLPNWGITLEQLVSVFNVLKPKEKPNPRTAELSKKRFLILLTGQEFYQSWLENSFGTRRVTVSGEDISTAIELIKLYRAANKLDGTVAN